MKEVGAAANIIAIIELSSKVATVIHDYSKDARNARDDIHRLRKAVRDLENVALSVRQLLGRPDGARLEASHQLLNSSNDSRLQLRVLYEKLRPKIFHQQLSRLSTHALKWPLESEEVERETHGLEGYRQTMSLALQVNQTTLSGIRTKSGCLGCRRRRRKCDETRPTCGACSRSRTQETCQWPSDSRIAKFVVSGAAEIYLLPTDETSQADFIHLSQEELAGLCMDYDEAGPSREPVRRVDPCSSYSTGSLTSQPSPWTTSPSEILLVQYYGEVISNSRVYVPGDNLFRSLVFPIILAEAGPLRCAVLALSAAERTRNCSEITALHYKQHALRSLQQHLSEASSAEENMLACVLLSSVEISSGSRPAWLRHLRGSFALCNCFETSISEAIMEFAVTYFCFRFVLIGTTMKLTATMAADFAVETEKMEELILDLDRSVAWLAASYDSATIQTINNYIGCSVELMVLIARTSRLANDLRSTPRDAELDVSIMELDNILAQVTFNCADSDNGYLQASAECFKLAARIYFYLVCYDASITHTTILALQNSLLKALSNIIEERQPRRSFPMWPLFIAGCVSSDDVHRKVVANKFRILDSKWPIGNISTVWRVIWTIWQSRDLNASNPAFKDQQDWQGIIQRFQWKLALS